MRRRLGLARRAARSQGWVAATGALILFLLAPGTAHAQSGTYARLVGTVTDQTGAVLPGVEVTATARATNVPKMALTNERGDYIIDKLIPGAYDARAELPGFKTQISQNFRLEVTQVGRRDFEMTPGEISEQVTVMGQSPIIDTDAVEVASLIEEKKILDLPLRGRDLLKLAFLTTGATHVETDVGECGGYYDVQCDN